MRVTFDLKIGREAWWQAHCVSISTKFSPGYQESKRNFDCFYCRHTYVRVRLGRYTNVNVERNFPCLKHRLIEDIIISQKIIWKDT